MNLNTNNIFNNEKNKYRYEAILFFIYKTVKVLQKKQNIFITK
jgi:hypothetical protein